MKLSSLVDAVSATDEEVVITKNGVPAAVLVSPDEFESWRETVAIRFDQESMEEIRTACRTQEGQVVAVHAGRALQGLIRGARQWQCTGCAFPMTWPH